MRNARFCTVIALILLLIPCLRAEQEGVPKTWDIDFVPGKPHSQLQPRFSPYGTRVTLKPQEMQDLSGYDHLEGTLRLGSLPEKDSEQRFALARSEQGKPYDLLFIDRDLDGSLGDEKAISTEPRINRDKWWSSFRSSVQVRHQIDAQTVLQDYPISFWIVVEDPDEVPKLIRYSRRGFLAAETKIEGMNHAIVISDADNDGILGTGDYWTICSTNEEYSATRHRRVGDFDWANGRAYKLEILNTAGTKARLTAHDPGISQEEDEASRDRYRVDRLAPRSKKPVSFRRDVERAIEDAKTKDVPYFLDFEASWCGSCKVMDQLVYTAQDVVDAAGDTICIKVDVDQRKDLKVKYMVTGCPSGILFRPEGREIARFSGYRTVKQMAQFFQMRGSESSKVIDLPDRPLAKELRIPEPTKPPSGQLFLLIAERRPERIKGLMTSGHLVPVVDEGGRLGFLNGQMLVARRTGIAAYDLQGEHLRQIPRSTSVKYYTGFVAIPDGRFAFLDNRDDVIYFVDSNGGHLKTVRMTEAPDGHLQNTDGIVIADRLIMSENGRKQLIEVDMNTYEVSVFCDLRGLPGPWLGAIAYGRGVIYVCTPNRVYALSVNRQARREVAALPPGQRNITGITYHAGYLYVVVNKTGTLYRIDPVLGTTELIRTGLNYPESVVSLMSQEVAVWPPDSGFGSGEE